MSGTEGSGASAGGILEPLRHLVRRSRRATELLQTLHFRLTHRSTDPPIVVHQMARVGSITVLHAILAHVHRARVFHTHWLNPATIAAERARLDRLHAVRGDVGLSRELLAAELLDDRRRASPTERWRVVTLVRDPVARTVSAFFRHFPANHPDLPATFHADPANVPRLLELFLAPDEPERRLTRDWLDREVRDVFGIDVYASPFDPDAGFATYASPSCDLLLLRTEALDRVGNAALRDFLGIPALSLVTRNRGEDQSYGAAYAEFMRRLRLPHAYIDEMYASPLARWLFSPDERQRLRERWAAGR